MFPCWFLRESFTTGGLIPSPFLFTIVPFKRNTVFSWILEVFQKEESLERMGKVSLEIWVQWDTKRVFEIAVTSVGRPSMAPHGHLDTTAVKWSKYEQNLKVWSLCSVQARSPVHVSHRTRGQRLISADTSSRCVWGNVSDFFVNSPVPLLQLNFLDPQNYNFEMGYCNPQLRLTGELFFLAEFEGSECLGFGFPINQRTTPFAGLCRHWRSDPSEFDWAFVPTERLVAFW